jgi:hypothetical protein
MKRQAARFGRWLPGGSAAMLLAGATAWCPLAWAGAQSEPVNVITNTRAYCNELSARAGELRRHIDAPSEEALLIAAEGDRLCAQGQIRPGIMRLRRAIMLLREQGRPEATGR